MGKVKSIAYELEDEKTMAVWSEVHRLRKELEKKEEGITTQREAIEIWYKQNLELLSKISELQRKIDEQDATIRNLMKL